MRTFCPAVRRTPLHPGAARVRQKGYAQRGDGGFGMERQADSGGIERRRLNDPFRGWGPTVLIVVGALLILLGLLFWGWVVQNTGVKSPLRPVPTWLIMSGLLVALAGAPAWWLFWWFLDHRATKTR